MSSSTHKNTDGLSFKQLVESLEVDNDVAEQRFFSKDEIERAFSKTVYSKNDVLKALEKAKRSESHNLSEDQIKQYVKTLLDELTALEIRTERTHTQWLFKLAKEKLQPCFVVTSEQKNFDLKNIGKGLTPATITAFANSKADLVVSKDYKAFVVEIKAKKIDIYSVIQCLSNMSAVAARMMILQIKNGFRPSQVSIYGIVASVEDIAQRKQSAKFLKYEVNYEISKTELLIDPGEFHFHVLLNTAAKIISS